MDDSEHDAAKEDRDQLASELALVKVGSSEIAIAGEMTEIYALGANDALQLASADSLSDSSPVFVSADHHLVEAASVHGFATVPLGS